MDYDTLRAALVLALHDADAGATIEWWEGVCKDPKGNSCMVVQIPRENPKYLEITQKVFKGYNIKTTPVSGSAFWALPIACDQLENYLPVRVTRTWKPDPDAPNDKWKAEVVDQMDKLGVKYAKMEFSGAGDSGNEDQWECGRSHNPWYYNNHDNADQKHWQEQNSLSLPDDLCSVISEYVWESLVQVDCVNNDGGGGDLQIDLSEDTPIFLFNCYTNETVQHQHNSDEQV